MAYTPNQVLIDSSSTTVPASITLKQSGIYELRLVGGGGGGYFYFYMNDNFTSYGTYYASGGSGSVFWGQVYLEAGTYTVQLGTGGSMDVSTSSGGNSIFGSCIAYGGTGGYINGNSKTPPSSVVAGSGGSTPSIEGCEIISIEMLKDGNNGRTGGGSGDQSQTKVYGGSSAYGDNVGAGGGFNGTEEAESHDGLVYLMFVSAPEESEPGSGNGGSESPEDSTTFIKKSLGEMAIPTTNYYKYTNANVNIVGSLTDTNGILGNFSSSNYALIPSRFENNSQPYEIKVKVTTGSDVTNNQVILGDIEHGSDILAIWMGQGKFHLFMSSDNVGTYDVQTNTTYYIKVVDDGNTTKLYYSLDSITYTEDISLATRIGSSVRFAIGTDYDTSYWKGSIDLKESYIKINGNIWWRGMQVEKGTSEDYNFYTESYSFKTYAKKETDTESVYRYGGYYTPVMDLPKQY